MLEYFFVKARSETPIIYYGSRMTQQELQLIGKIVVWVLLWFGKVLSEHKGMCVTSCSKT
jgi:hypothetical protein